MSNVLQHRFVSPKLDGPDLTQVQPSAWNDGHQFSGGLAGDVLTRDTSDPTFGAKWSAPPVWIDRAFDAAKFFASGGSWTVAAPTLNAFIVQGHTITYALSVNGSTVTGTPAYLIVSTNEVLGPAARPHSAVFTYWCSGYSGAGNAEWSTSAAAIYLLRDIGGTAWAATGNLFIRLTIIGSL